MGRRGSKAGADELWGRGGKSACPSASRLGLLFEKGVRLRSRVP